LGLEFRVLEFKKNWGLGYKVQNLGLLIQGLMR